MARRRGERNSVGTRAASKDNSRTEEFKRATTGVVRAIAGSQTCRWRSSPGPRLHRQPGAAAAADPGAAGGGDREAARCVDSLALRLRHHDDAVHAARMPQRREARDAYDALEQARVETVGSHFMSGVSANLRAKLTEECEAEGYDRMTRKDQMPIAAALALLARERMSGEASPAPARRILDLWRDTLGEAADTALAEMHQAQADQTAFARAARKLLAALDLAEAEAEAEPDDQTEEGEDGGEQSGQQDENPEGEGSSESDPRLDARRAAGGDGGRGGRRRRRRVRGRRRGGRRR